MQQARPTTLKIRFSTQTKLILLSLLIMVPVFAAFFFLTQNSVTNALKSAATEKAKSDLVITYALIDAKYPGPWSIKNGQLVKGNTVMDGNFGLIDYIGNATGDTATLFLNDARVATNVTTAEGKRAVGVKVSAQVADVVLDKGQNFYGEANVVGKQYQTAYMPIKDQSGKIIGMWYVGASQSLLDTLLAGVAKDILTTTAVSLIVAVLLYWLFARSISTKIQMLLSAMEKAEQGDVTTAISIKGTDEFAELAQKFTDMNTGIRNLLQQVQDSIESMKRVVRTVNTSIEETVKASQQVAVNISQVAAGSEEQSRSFVQVTEVIGESAQGMEDVNRSSETMSALSDQVLSNTQEGAKVVNQSLEQMEVISGKVQNLGTVIQTLSGSTSKITEITETITSIANQTHLLALNAAIEAARAGEHGRGFAVVADEVRKLAEQSSHFAEQIQQTIKEVNHQIVDASSAMEESQQAVEVGHDLSKSAETSFQGIQQQIFTISENIQNISAALQQMGAASQEINQLVSQVSSITQENSAQIQEVAAFSEEQSATMEEAAGITRSLNEVATELEESLKRFKL